jgi:hypothetical protein
LGYVYDFGDGWTHDLTVEKVLAPEPGVLYPRCASERRACPPEDVGGPWGYDGFLEVMGDPKTSRAALAPAQPVEHGAVHRTARPAANPAVAANWSPPTRSPARAAGRSS